MHKKQKNTPARRSGPDFWLKLIKWFSFFSWLFLFVIIYIVSKAAPEVENFFDKILNVHLRDSWDESLIGYAIILTIILLLMSVFGLVINAKRHRRKTDRYDPSLIIMALLSVIGIIVFAVIF